MGKKASIEKQLIIKYAILIVVFGILCMSTGIILGKRALIANSRELLSNFALEIGKRISHTINLEVQSVEIVADDPIVRSQTATQEEKFTYLRKIVQTHGYKKAALIDLEGNCVTMNGENVNVAEREYFINASKGKSFLTAPFISAADGGLQIAIAAPIYDNEKTDEIIGVLFFSKDAEEFSAITNDISFGVTGTAYVVDEKGTNIINRDIEKVIQKVNRIEDAKTKPEYKELAAVTERMIAGESGTGTYEFDGVTKFVGYAPIEAKGWAIGITTEMNDMLSGIDSLINGLAMFICFMLVSMIVITYIITEGLSKRLKGVEEEVNEMTTRNFM